MKKAYVNLVELIFSSDFFAWLSDNCFWAKWPLRVHFNWTILFYLDLWLVSEHLSLGSHSQCWPTLLLDIVQRQYCLGVSWNCRYCFAPIWQNNTKQKHEMNEATSYFLQIELMVLAAFLSLCFSEFGDKLCKTLCMSWN